MSDLIRRDDLLDLYNVKEEYKDYSVPLPVVIQNIKDMSAVDAIEVVRCGKCQYYHKPHVLCDDGTEKDYSEFPKEAFGIAGLVNGKYGINVGGKCEREKNCGYAEDKSVFRKPTDFCSYGERREGNEID